MINTSRFTTALVVLLPMLLMLSSCDDFDPTTDLNGTKGDIVAMLESTDIVQKASVDSDNFVFNSRAGTTITAEPNSFVFADGSIASGMIDFELTELFTKSEILQYGIPTMTYRSEILESDGEFLFGASQNGNELEIAAGKALQVMVRNPEPNPGMQLFDAVEGFWGLSNSLFNVILELDTSNVDLGYEFFATDLDWVNVDYFTKFDLELTDISLCLPEGYDQEQVVVWLVFKDLDVVLPGTGTDLPVGEAVYAVCIAAEDDENFRLDIQEVTIAVDLKVNLDPEKASVEEIKRRLKELD